MALRNARDLRNAGDLRNVCVQRCVFKSPEEINTLCLYVVVPRTIKYTLALMK